MVSKTNPDTPTMKDATPDGLLRGSVNDGVHNHGFAVSAARAGQKIIEPYGLDRSTEAGTAQDERATERGVKGSVTNLAHSLGGATAKNGMSGKDGMD